MEAPEQVLDLSREACEERLRAGLLYITEHPKHWDQNTWGATTVSGPEYPCGTSACLFGHVAIAAGLAEPGRAYKTAGRPGWLLEINDAGIELLKYTVPMAPLAGVRLAFLSLGALLLGLSGAQAYELSDLTNSLATLWRLAAEITEGRVSLPAELRAAVNKIDDARRAPSLD